MPRLVAFGCSYTQGSSLDDNYQFPPYPAVPSIFAWPQVLANLLGLECKNYAVGGSGNLEILWELLKKNVSSNDIVLLGWSHFNREIIFDKQQEFSRMLDNEETFKRWLLAHPESDINIRNWLYIHHANKYLESKKITAYNVFCAFDIDPSTKPSWIEIDNMLPCNFQPLDRGHDGLHPGIKSHEDLANNIYKYITNVG